MIIAAIVGIVVGYILAIPPGPIGMAAIRTGIRSGWLPSAKLAMGAGILDVLYCALAMLAASAIDGVIEDLRSSAPWAHTALQLVIVAAMLVYGWIMMRQRPEAIPTEDTEDHPPVKGAKVSSWIQGHGPFFVGAGFAVANLANPSFIPALMSTTTLIQRMELFETTTLSALAFAVGFGAGNVFWLLTLTRLVMHFRKRMTPTFIQRIHQVSGLTLIGLGIYYGIRIVMAL